MADPRCSTNSVTEFFGHARSADDGFTDMIHERLFQENRRPVSWPLSPLGTDAPFLGPREAQLLLLDWLIVNDDFESRKECHSVFGVKAEPVEAPNRRRAFVAF